MSQVERQIARLSAKQRALFELRLAQLRADRPRDIIGRRSSGSGFFPLSFSQQRLWFVDQFESGSAFYNIPYAVRVKGPLHAEVLVGALGAAVRRHESLRTVFGQQNSQPVQIVEPCRAVEIPVIDLGALAGRARESEARRLAAQEAQRPFDLSHGPLFRCALLRLAWQEHVVTLVVHHIIADGESLRLLFRDLIALYRAILTGTPSGLSDLPIQYPDFALWQRDWMRDAFQQQAAYWRRQLAGSPTCLKLACDHPRPEVQGFRGAQHAFVLPRALCDSLEALGHEECSTSFMVLLAGYQVLVHHYADQDDIIVSAPMSYRDRSETAGLVGFFANTLLFRTLFTGEPTFREFLGRVRRTVMEAYAHQFLPLEHVVRELAPSRSLSYSPFLQVGMNYFAHDLEDMPRLPSVIVEEFSFDVTNVQFDLNLVLIRNPQGIRANLQYKIELFERSTVEHLAGQLRHLLELIAERPDATTIELRRLLGKRDEERRGAEKAELERSSVERFKSRQRRAVNVEVEP